MKVAGAPTWMTGCVAVGARRVLGQAVGAQVRHPQMARSFEQQVRRLHVAVDDTLLVGMVQRFRRLHPQPGDGPMK